MNDPSLSQVPTLSTPRQFHLDWLRIAAFGLLVPYHVGMYYVSWGWHIKSPQLHPALEPAMLLSSPWRMDLLFVVSGAATALMLRGGGVPSFAWLRRRGARLLLPLLAGMVVIVPPQSWLEVRERFGYAGGFFDFLPLYLRGGDGRFCDAAHGCLVLPTWNHLWYLPYLAVYTLLLWAVLRRFPALLPALARRTAAAFSGTRLLWLPPVLLLASRWLLARRFPATHALVDDWFMHLQYLAMFAFGTALAQADALARSAAHRRWPALLLALAGWAGLQVPDGPAWSRAIAFCLLQWGALVAAVGFAHRHWNVDHPWRAALAEAVFPLYLLHQTAIIGFAWALRPAHLPIGVEAPLLVAATFASGWLFYRLARRSGPLRIAFGLKPDVPARAARRTTAIRRA